MQYLARDIGNRVQEKHKDAFRHKDIIKKLEARGELFKDPEFPPEYDSLAKTSNAPKTWQTYTWKRSTEFMDQSQMAVFRDIEPNDIRQGSLGDCYFLCCLSVLAERPKLVKRLFITEEPNQAGCYAIWLNANGSWKSYILDDYFPCTAHSGPAFTRSNGPELWVLLLEKAYAKAYGGYDIIEGGHPALALRDLTGAPYDFLESEDSDEVWEYVKNSNDRQYLLTCYTKSTETREEKNPLGIVSGHAYSILDAQEVITTEGKERIIQIRNPWGKFEWKGDWSDNSSKWTPEVIKQVKDFTKAEDGAFWMNVNDFVQYYEGVGISKLHEDYYYRSVNIAHDQPYPRDYFSQNDVNIPYENPNTSILRMKVNQKTHLFLSLNQADDRMFMGTDKADKYEFSIARILLAKVEPFGLRYISGIFYNDRNVVIEESLNAGHYIITIEIMWAQDFYKNFNLSAYTQYPVDFEQIGKADIDQIQRNIIKSMIMSDETTKKKTYDSIHEPDITRYTGSKFGIAYFFYQNNSSKGKTLNETVTLTQRQNLRVCAPFANNNQFEVNVLPKNDALVMFKCIDGGEYVFATKTSFKASVIEHNEMIRYAQMAYTKTTYLDDLDDAINKSADTSYYDEFIRDDRDNLEIFDYDKVAEDMKSGLTMGIGGRMSDRQSGANPETAKPEYSYLAGNQKFLDPFLQKSAEVAAQPIVVKDTLSGKSIFSFEVLKDIPKYIHDDSDYSELPLQQFEKNYARTVSSFVEGYQRYLDIAFVATLAMFLLLPLFISLLKAQFLDIAIGIIIALFLISKQSSYAAIEKGNLVLRSIPFIMLVSAVLDILWLMIYSGNWTNHDIFDMGLLRGTKELTMSLTYISIIVKLLLALIFEKKMVQALEDQQSFALVY